MKKKLKLKAILTFLVVVFIIALYIYIAKNKHLSNEPNIILITIDTLRADNLPCYGYDRNTTPFICDFAREGILFENSFVQIPLTGPSHASILSSRYPDSHGLLKHESILNKNVTFISQILKKENYTTGAYVNVLTLDPKFGFNRGFDTYTHNGTQNAAETNDYIFTWIKKNKNKKFFLWVHYFDPHFTYNPPYPYNKFYSKEPTTFDLYNNLKYKSRDILFYNLFNNNTLTTNDLNRAIALYDGEILFVDENLKQLFKYLKDNGLYDNALIIITADHGEGFDHDYYFNHPMFVYDSFTHVPLIIKFPHSLYQNLRINNLVESVDIAPTVLDYLGINISLYFEGQSLLSMIETNKSRKSYVFSQSAACSLINKKCFPKGYTSVSRSIRNNRWKLILNPYNDSFIYELYDLKSDPDELINVYSKHPKLAKELSNILLNKISQKPNFNDSIELDQETINKLKSLGYMN